MAYIKQEWKDLPNKTTPVNATRMNHLEQGISDLYDAIFPIGQIVIKGDNEDYSNWLGFTWERTAVGKVLVGIDGSDTDFNTIGKTGGEKKHTLTVYELPAKIPVNYGNISGGTDVVISNTAVGLGGVKSGQANMNLQSTANPHNIVQPYQVVAYWKRIA